MSMSSISLAPLLLGLFLASGWASPPCYPLPVVQLSLGNCTVRVPDRTDVNSWGFQVGLEGAGSQCVVPSTVVNHTFLTTEDVCADKWLRDTYNVDMTKAQCRSRRGGFISQSQSLPGASTDGVSGANIDWTGLQNEINQTALATLKLAEGAVSMIVGLITGGQQSTASHLGLASNSVFLQTLKERGLIAARSFGLDVGSQSIASPRSGSLVLGGYDRGRSSSSYKQYQVASEILGDRHCPLQVKVTEIKLIGSSIDNNTGETRQNDSVILSRTSNTQACIEPYDNLFRLPTETIGNVKAWFKGLTSWQNETVEPDEYKGTLLNPEPGLVYPAKAGSFNGSMRVTIDNEFPVDIPLHELWRPLRGLDPNGKIILNDRYNELQVYNSNDSGKLYAAVLGKAFLSQVYLFVDYEAQPPVFRLTLQYPETMSSSAVSSASCSGGLSPSDKGLIGVGTVLGALIMTLLAYAFYRYCWTTTKKPNPPSLRVPTIHEDETPAHVSASSSSRSSISGVTSVPMSDTTTPAPGTGVILGSDSAPQLPVVTSIT